jgi:hypothetical protein
VIRYFFIAPQTKSPARAGHSGVRPRRFSR